MTPYHITDDTLLNVTPYGLLLHNEGVGKDVTIRLPQPYAGRQFEILQLSRFRITLHTNSDEVFFLGAKQNIKLTIAGTEKAIGRSLIIGTFRNNWRVLQSTFTESQLTFEE